MTCTTCGAVIGAAHAHRFENVKGKPVGVYCDECCPRCWSDRRELAK